MSNPHLSPSFAPGGEVGQTIDRCITDPPTVIIYPPSDLAMSALYPHVLALELDYLIRLVLRPYPGPLEREGLSEETPAPMCVPSFF